MKEEPYFMNKGKFSMLGLDPVHNQYGSLLFL